MDIDTSWFFIVWPATINHILQFALQQIKKAQINMYQIQRTVLNIRKGKILKYRLVRWIWCRFQMCSCINWRQHTKDLHVFTYTGLQVEMQLLKTTHPCLGVKWLANMMDYTQTFNSVEATIAASSMYSELPDCNSTRMELVRSNKR